VRVSWDSPIDNYSPVVAYTILVKDRNGDMKEETLTCDGTDFEIVSSRECFIPLTILIGSQFSLLQGDLV
jgi:hypothetical protein